MEEADAKAVAFERINELEDELGRTNELFQELEVRIKIVNEDRNMILMLPYPSLSGRSTC